jgi:hypothetical protein
MVRALALLLMVAIAVAAPASAQQHWLVGTWTGALTNQPMNSRTGPERTLVITSVSADGATAQATWANATSSNAQKVNVAIAGNDISFTTAGSSGANYKLKHNAGTLSGDWAPAGGATRGGSVNLKKQ